MISSRPPWHQPCCVRLALSEVTAPPSYGSAKAGLLGLERMREAWDQLVARRIVAEKEAAPFVTTIAWLIEETDRLIPEARAFIRPGFDELAEVRRLEEEERAGAS